MPADLPPDTWHLVAPIGIADSVTAAVDLPPGERGLTWEVFAWRDNAYVRATSLLPGEAVWFRHSEGGTLEAPRAGFVVGDVEAGCRGTDGCRAVELDRGPAMVGNPFHAPVALPAVSVAAAGACADGCSFADAAAAGLVSDAVLTWNGQAYSDPRDAGSGELAAGQGAWMNVLAPNVRLLIADPLWPATYPAESAGPARAPGVGSTRLDEFGHQYSRRQVWNADETLLFSGSEVWRDGSAVAASPLSSRSMWSTDDPALIYGVQFTDAQTSSTLARWNVVTGAVESLRTFPDAVNVSIGRGEGALSDGDRRVVLVSEDRMIAYDLVEDRVLGERAVPPGLDWVGFDQTGDWIVSDDDVNGLIRYDADLSNPFVLGVVGRHGDFCIDAAGDSVYAQVGTPIAWIRLDDGVQVTSGLSGGGHVSCRNLERPGHAYLSLRDGAVGAIELIEGVDEIEWWAEHGSSWSSYEIEPQVSVSPSGRRLVYRTDAGETGAHEIVLSVRQAP